MVERLRETGAKVVWRCHIGRDTPTALTDEGWAFLRPLIEDADAFVFSRRAYAPAWIRRRQAARHHPSIDPFSAKNALLTDAAVEATLGHAGLLEGAADPRRGGVREARRHPRGHAARARVSTSTACRYPSTPGW